jgi:hypothetical protein
MASDVINVNPDQPALPNSKQLRSNVIPRIAANIRDDQRGALTGALTNIAGILDATVIDFDKTTRTTALSPAGREYHVAKALTDAEGAIKVFADTATRDHRDHIAQLDAELSHVEPINEFRATEIRQLLRGMSTSEREAFIGSTGDPEVLAAVIHGPRSFPLASDGAVARGLRTFNKAHRLDKVALRDDAESYVTAVENFGEMVLRDLRRALK